MSQDDTWEKQERRDFFISYTGQDKPWAEWIAAQLDAAGYTIFFQAWDFRPGSNFVAEMDHAAKRAERTLLVLSPAYLESDYSFAEWATAFRHDPTGTHRQLLPVRIEACTVEGLLGPVVYIDLVSLEEDQARTTLLAGVQQERAKPVWIAFPQPRTPHSPAVPFPVEIEKEDQISPGGSTKFAIHNNAPVQGQIIGDQNTITQHFGGLPKVKRKES
jgi:hypothetical protein